MEQTQHPERRLHEMPDDILRLILSKVGSASATDLVNTISSCKSLNFGLNDHLLAKNLNLQPLVNNPLLANRYNNLIDGCLNADNLSAHYIKGVLEYFHTQNHELGMQHIEIASNGGHEEGGYLYGSLLISLEMIEKGKEVITRKNEKKGVVIDATTWEDITISLSAINLSMRKFHARYIQTTESDLACRKLEITTCWKCFHCYMIFEYVEMMIGLKPA